MIAGKHRHLRNFIEVEKTPIYERIMYKGLNVEITYTQLIKIFRLTSNSTRWFRVNPPCGPN